MPKEHPPQLTNLIERLAKLPGLGRKSATRLALHLLGGPSDEALELAAAIVAVKNEVHFCSECFTFAETDPCPLCADPLRDRTTICVVETPADLMVIESAGLYRGLYHVLGGVLAPLAGQGPESLKIEQLALRLDKAEASGQPVTEVILATGSSPEALATCSYLAQRLADHEVKVTRLARGLPLGVDLEYVDNGTLKEALTFRREA
ncbi:MAG: recombination mediator RecR [Deltaproteobacteria bacterium]|jgi:recombination protein RecR|nr:recombination mediator RecR [Deltaproteobacteria bacterium]